jgi:hypothetical protein
MCFIEKLKFDYIEEHLDEGLYFRLYKVHNDFEDHQDVFGKLSKVLFQKHLDIYKKYELLHFENKQDKTYNHFSIGFHLMV